MEPNLAELDELRPTDLRAEVARRIAEPRRPLPQPGGTVKRLMAGVVAVAVFAAAAVFAWAAFNGGEDVVPATDPWAWAPEGWTELPSLPDDPGGEAWVWAGDRLLAWGGCIDGDADVCAPSSEGWSFDPVARAWERMPDAPLGGASAPAVWTGQRAVFLGLGDTGRSAQAFDPVAGTWEGIEDAPVDLAGSSVVVWTGREVIAWAGNHGAAFDPSLGSWRRIADAPTEMTLASGAWSGRELFVIGALLDRRNRSASPTAEGLAYDPVADSWRSLPPSALWSGAVSASWVDGRLVAWDYDLQAQTLDPSVGAWSEPATIPLSFSECYNDSATIGGVVFGWYCGDAALYDPAHDAWTALRGGPLEDTVYSEAYERSIDVWRFAQLVPSGEVLVLPLTGLTLTETGEACYGCEGSPLSYWVYRPPSVVDPGSSAPLPGRAAARAVVDDFMIARVDGAEGRIVWVATAAALEMFGTIVPEPLYAGRQYRVDDLRSVGGGVFEAHVTLILNGPVGDDLGLEEVQEVLVIGPGESAGGVVDAPYVVTSVRPADRS